MPKTLGGEAASSESQGTRPVSHEGIVPVAASALSNSDLEAIRGVHEDWIAAELRGDWHAVLALCTDDVRWLAPNSPIVEGKDAGRRFFEDSLVRLEEIRTTDMRVDGTEKLAYKTCRYETRFRAQSGSGQGVAQGTHLWILRRVEGRWKVALVTWQPEGDSL